MKAATEPNRRGQRSRLLAVDAGASWLLESTAAALPSILRVGDVLVVNDAGTLPASLRARTKEGAEIEVRLCARIEGTRWRVVALGHGDWRTDTNLRMPPPKLTVGDAVTMFGGPLARVIAVSPLSSRLVDLEFAGTEREMWSYIFRSGKVVQYSYQDRELELSWMQNRYASPPVSVEMPSAGRALDLPTLLALRRSGIAVVSLTHAAGLSATGDAELDAILPLAERYEIPESCHRAIEQARARGGRVIAVGTTVVRALEGNVASYGILRAGRGETSLIIDGDHFPRIVDGVLAGVFAPGESHFRLLRAFAPASALEAVYEKARELGIENHELGDHLLVLPELPPQVPRGWREHDLTAASTLLEVSAEPLEALSAPAA